MALTGEAIARRALKCSSADPSSYRALRTKRTCLRGVVWQVAAGGSVCDIGETYVQEWYGGQWHYRWAARTTHTIRGGTGIFAIATSGNGEWNVYPATTMVEDSGCPWFR